MFSITRFEPRASKYFVVNDMMQFNNVIVIGLLCSSRYRSGNE